MVATGLSVAYANGRKSVPDRVIAVELNRAQTYAARALNLGRLTAR
jgi:hypothetical protein